MMNELAERSKELEANQLNEQVRFWSEGVRERK